MKRPPSNSRRPGRQPRNERRIIKVYPEGKVTEYEYLRYWEQQNLDVTLQWGEHGMAPKTLVRLACKDIKKSHRSEKRHGSPDFDEIWCVFDVDSHPDIPQALFEAHQGGVHVALSNPCFELWLVLHCEDQRAYVERHRIQQRASELGLLEDKSRKSGKSIVGATLKMLEENYEAAKRRAEDLDDLHEGNGSPPLSNPSTELWRLVDRIRT